VAMGGIEVGLARMVREVERAADHGARIRHRTGARSSTTPGPRTSL
jgi:hypothetical protein